MMQYLGEINLKEEKFVLAQRFQSMVIWPHHCDQAEHHGGEDMAEQSSLPHSSWEAETVRERKVKEQDISF
jgi:hypothetical protein